MAAAVPAVDVAWEEILGSPCFSARLRRFLGLILFDRRGMGAFLTRRPPIRCRHGSRMLELAVVLDEVGSGAGPPSWPRSKPPRPRSSSPAPNHNAPVRSSWCTPKPSTSPATTPIGGSPPRKVPRRLLAQVDQLWGTDAMAAMFIHKPSKR